MVDTPRLSSGTPGLPASPSRSGDSQRLVGHLPPESGNFIGREQEMVEVKRLLASSRLLTLAGPGGCGKTRLAVRVAADLVKDFEYGVWWVELESLSDPAFVPSSVASALKVSEAPDRSLTEVLAEHLANKNALLVLNNCEHLIPACTALLDVLLRSCSSLRILTTSRQALGLDNEISWSVPPLSVPDLRRLPTLEGLERSEAVRLFVDRATGVVPTFAPTESTASALARLCHRLDGVPLAIELAAARTNVLTVEQIFNRLDDSIRLLRGGRSKLPRHQTLRAAMDWSHDLLSKPEQILFRRLSVFAGGFTLSAAETVCPGGELERSEVLDILSSLVDKSLVLLTGRTGEEARYRTLETMRQYAQEKLAEAGEAMAMRQCHAEFVLSLAQEAEPALQGPEQGAWLKRLEAEYDNLRGALEYFRETADVEQGFRLGSALWRFWWLQGHFTEGRAHLEALLTLPEAQERTRERAKALYVLGVLACRQADYAAGNQAEAHAYQQESLEIYQELGDEPHVADVLRELGRISIELGNWTTARSFLEESLKLERESGSEHGVALTLNSLGWLEHFCGANAAARPLFEQARKIFRKLGDALFADICLFFLGRIATDEGDYAEAHARLSATVDERLPHYPWVIPPLLEAFAGLASAQGQARRALKLAGAAMALRDDIGVKHAPAWRVDLSKRLEGAWESLNRRESVAAWNEGQAMTPEEAVTYALQNERTYLSQTHTQTLRIFALGATRVERGGYTLNSSDWGYAKPRELLFYLLSHQSRSKDRIGLDLWPDASAVQLRRTFHVTLHHLRRALGGAEWIVYEGGRYTFNRSLDYFFDVEVFESKLAAARQHKAEAPEKAIKCLVEATELYRGDYLEDLIEGEWTLTRREELRRKYGEAMLTLGRLLSTEKRYAEAAEVYRRTISHDRMLEVAHRELMFCYAALGERGQALRQYEALVELLHKEHGLSPAIETRELFERLCHGEDPR